MPATEDAQETFERGKALLVRLSPAGAALPWDTFADIAPALGNSVAHAFGSIVSRPGLDLRTRELITVTTLATLGGCEAQVAFHIGAALRAGATAEEIVEALTQLSVYAGIPRALNAVTVARSVFAEHGVSPAS
jgi:4-carboxymuconolactone decarboxylase